MSRQSDLTIDENVLDRFEPVSFEEYDADFEEDFKALGVDPAAPTGAKPGSDEKVMTLAARYAAGLPLWHNSDCYDHGPGLGNVDLTAFLSAGGSEEEAEEQEEAEVA